MTTDTEIRPPVPPFSRETAIQKIRMAEDGWNSRDPQRVSMVYTPDSQWRNRAEFPRGRAEIVEFLTRKWAKELDYRLIKELWAFDGNRIAVAIAHRLSTIAAMDRLIVLDQGKIVEEGSHKKLLANKGLYASLWSHQSGGFLGE